MKNLRSPPLGQSVFTERLLSAGPCTSTLPRACPRVFTAVFGEDAVRVPVYSRGFERWSTVQDHKAVEFGWTHFSLIPQPGAGTCVLALRWEIVEGGGEGWG